VKDVQWINSLERAGLLAPFWGSVNAGETGEAAEAMLPHSMHHFPGEGKAGFC
jgi:hypothetical protein